MNKVVKGAYEGQMLNRVGKKVYVVTGFMKMMEINNETVKSYEVQNEQEKSPSAGSILAFGLLAPKTHSSLVKIEWKDGQTSLIECDEKILRAINIQCFE